MKYFDWAEDKNEWLKTYRDISFEEIELYISEGKIIDIIENPNQDKYPNQRIFILNIDHYIWYVPFIEDSEKMFLRTAYPTRQGTKVYIGNKNEK